MTTKLTSTQRAALMKLIDGEWREMRSFQVNTTLASLAARKLVDTRAGFSPSGVLIYRITAAGRTAIFRITP